MDTADRTRSRKSPRRTTHTQRIIDSTLRDGEQAPGVVFSIEEKRRILELLHRVGIEEVEVGTPSIGEQEQREITELLALGASFDMQLFCWCRGHRRDLEAAATTGADRIHIGLPVSHLQMRAAGLTRSLVLRRLEQILQEARGAFAHVSVGAQDAVRADPAFLRDYIACAASAGAFRVRLADTVGVGLPDRVAAMVKEIKTTLPALQIEFHAHNDYGLATANALSALSAGADAVSATVLGLGERAGNASLEAVLLGALHLTRSPLPYTPQGLAPLCRTVSEASGRPIPAAQPLVGEAVLTHESGIHVSGQLSHPRCYQPFAAADVGRSDSEFLYSKMSGRAAALHLFRKVGRAPSEREIRRLLRRIAAASAEKKRALNESEVLAMLNAESSAATATRPQAARRPIAHARRARTY